MELLDVMQLAPFAYVFEEAPKELFSAKFVINPGSTNTFSAFRTMSSTEWENMSAGASVLVIWGEIRYSDVFSVRRRTRFKLRLRFSKGEYGPECIWSFCDTGNDAT